MSNGILTQNLQNSTTPASSALPDWTSNPASANLNEMAGPVQQATTYTPPQEALVSSQLERILAKDSPYLDMARTRATQMASKRGLMNSSIAASGGEAAAIQSALPIAQQDAQTYDNAGRFNADASNTFARDANAFGRQGALAKFGGSLDLAKAREAQQFTAGQSALNREFQTTEREASQGWQSGERAANEQFTTGRDNTQFQNRLTEINAQAESAIKVWDAQNGTRLFDDYRAQSQASYDSYLQQVQAIQVADLDPDIKAAQIAQLQQLYEVRQQFVNTMFAETPRWMSEWSQFDMSFAPEMEPA